MKKFLVPLTALLFLASAPSFAEDCGEPPLETPAVPNGATATADELKAARDSIVDYSDRVDAYLVCMDRRAQQIIPFLSKDQKTRWDEDLNLIHEARRDLQVRMNEAIREYRRAQQN